MHSPTASAATQPASAYAAPWRARAAFRRFKNELYQGHPELISSWHALRDARAQIRAVQWLADEGLIGEDAAKQFVQDHPEPALP